MFFSVIVPTHHRPKPLRDLLQSLANQDFPMDQFEVLLVPSPQDSGVQRLETFPFHLRVLDNSQDPYRGKSASDKRNRGAREAKAPWLAFIDDDCVADSCWLKNAQQRIRSSDIDAIEGLTKIPQPKKITYTYKGLQRLSREGGYQTCNMFYKRQTFLDCGGFDLKFPFYLEDTDLAWTLLDRGHKIVFDPHCIVKHPVPPPDVDRLYYNAVRTFLLPYLYKKHKTLFRQNRWRALQRFQWLFLGAHTSLIVWLILDFQTKNILISIFAVFLLSFTYTARQLHNCSFMATEALKMMVYFTITPWITVVQLWKGNWEHKTLLWR